jgi:gamma-glutamylaminecyclotransferase
MQGRTRIFVYGTLRRGGSNHALLSGAACEGEARTREPFAMFDLGGFPCIVPGGEERVAGEVFLVDAATLARLDALEDAPRWYRREAVRLDDGSLAEAYLYAQDVGSAPRVPGGDWLRRSIS